VVYVLLTGAFLMRGFSLFVLTGSLLPVGPSATNHDLHVAARKDETSLSRTHSSLNIAIVEKSGAEKLRTPV